MTKKGWGNLGRRRGRGGGGKRERGKRKGLLFQKDEGKGE